MSIKEKFSGVFEVGGRIAVLNHPKGFRPFGEVLINEGGMEYRFWDPNRSKLGAAVVKGITDFPIKPGSSILYLGAAHGYTVSFVSSIVGANGIVYAVEFSERCFTELLPVCKKSGNIVPIKADARFPERYGIYEKVDVVYCDIADRQQTDIAVLNCVKYLKGGGYLLLAIKSRSIDVVENPRVIVRQEIEKLKNRGFEIVEWKMLDPFERDHGFVVCRK